MSETVDKKYTVYIHLFPNGKRYVGCTRQKIKKRWRYGQGYRNQKLLFSAIEEFGWDNIEHIIVAEDLDEEVAREKERELIKEYKTQDREYGYNTKDGGQIFGEHSEEFLEKLNTRMVGNTYCVGRKLRPSHIEALVKGAKNSPPSYPFKGKHHTDEAKQIMSNKSRERWKNPKYRERMKNALPDVSGKNNPMYGKHHSEETKEKIRQKALGRNISDETKAKMSETHRKMVDQYTPDGLFVQRFSSLKKASESVDGNTSNIAFACRHKGRTYKGFAWRYADDDY